MNLPASRVESQVSNCVYRGLCWIRRDLRLKDHTSLALATAAAESVAVVFVFDTNILKHLQDRNDRRVTFIHESLRELDAKLRALGSMLVVRHGNPVDEIPALASALGCEAVFTARDYDPYAIARDQEVGGKLAAKGVEFRTVKDSVVFEGGEVLSQAGSPLRIYSPYAKAWRNRFQARTDADERTPELNRLISAIELTEHSVSWEMADVGFEPNSLWLKPGEDAANELLEAFRPKASSYGADRDFPAKSGTSAISTHLRFGTISIRECVRMALEIGTSGADKWFAELIWREFYQDILFHNPKVVTDTFQPQFNSLAYPGEDAWFSAWKEGKTGYPIIDAAMRCFNATGWMHNRLRMVVASFLTKDLLIDYRRGEAYFARYLLDFDLASNNGGWQWAASVGADPQPYFRIFNPFLQSVKFDPDGEFIRQWVPELAHLTGKSIHVPTEATAMELAAAGIELGINYPLPIVDHSVQRDLAIALLAECKGSATP